MAINPQTGLEDPSYVDPNSSTAPTFTMGSLGTTPQLVGAGASLASGAVTADAINKAAGTMQAGLDKAQTTIGNYAAPYTATGASANQQLSTGLQAGGQFNTPFTMDKAANMPAMEFAKTQGMDTIQNSAAAKGGLLGTNTLAGLEKFGQENAAQYENQAFNQWLQQNAQAMGGLENLSGTGAQVASTAGSNIAGLETQSAQTGMDATLGSANAYNQAVQNAISAYKGLAPTATTTAPTGTTTLPKAATGATGATGASAVQSPAYTAGVNATTPSNAIQAPTLVPSVSPGTVPGLGNTTTTLPTGDATLTAPVGLNGVSTSSSNVAPSTTAPTGASVALQPKTTPSMSVNSPTGQATADAKAGGTAPAASADTGAIASPVTGGYTSSTGQPLVQDPVTGMSVLPDTQAPELSIGAYDAFISSLTGTDPWSGLTPTAVDSWAEFAPTTTDPFAEFATTTDPFAGVDMSAFATPDYFTSPDFAALTTAANPTFTLDSFTPMDMTAIDPNAYSVI